MPDATILGRLRAKTAADHLALEDGLALLAPPLRRARFVGALQGFHAYHLAWEPRVEAVLGRGLDMAARRRLRLIEADLCALDARPDRAAAPDLAWLDGEAAAWGSLYVMEGSTLGGQVISRALAKDAPWAPQGGLAYFNPYGGETGVMWREFRAALESAAETLDAEAIVTGARDAFASLHRTLAAGLDALG